MSSGSKAARALLSALVLLGVALASPAHAAGYTVSVATDMPSYSGDQPIVVTGTVSPPPGEGTAVIVSITNSAGALADVYEAVPDPSTGAFSVTSHPGGNPAWTSGTFTVNATWGGDGSSATSAVTFAYAAPPAASSSASSSTASSSSSSAASSATSSGSRSSSSTSTANAPEFPPQSLAWLTLAALAVAALASARRAEKTH
ncbi:MAG: hypothetical protein JRN58_03235 [Nitrososphaerota archaeon]|nr:hypothetical protein [Nitrososphaerota archaeon]MDG6967144.1 hypothetical protein [Nitrososphaerota archaeon]MDG6978073.1 hypothetical protein [Nitrososphaerota archaeon]